LKRTLEQQTLAHETQRDQLTAQITRANATIGELQAKLSASDADRTALRERVRELEDATDTLERRRREAMASIDHAAFEAERALEEKAVVHTELEETVERDTELIQRLRDELRDVQAELTILKNSSSSSNNNNNNNNNNNSSNNNKSAISGSSATTSATTSTTTNVATNNNNDNNNNDNDNSSLAKKMLATIRSLQALLTSKTVQNEW
jgi:chromosome segregation ATPase